MTVELSVLAAFGAMLSWGVGDFLIQKAARRVGDLEALAFIGIVGSVALFPLVLAELPAMLDPYNFALMAVLGLVTVVAALLDFESLRKGKLSVVEVILEMELPVTVLLGIAFFGESLTLPQFGAIAAILAGIAMIARKRGSGGLKGVEKGAVLAVLAAVSMGFVNFLTAAGARQVSPLMAVCMPWLIISIISFAILFRRDGWSKVVSGISRFRRLMLAMALCDTAAWLLFAYAVQGSVLSVTIAITESYTAVALLLGLLVNKEKIVAHQFAGAGIAVAASLLLGFVL